MIQPPPKHITPHGEKLLEALRAQTGEWLARSDIAAAIGKKRLTQYDMAMLDLLADQQLIEKRQKEGYSPLGYMWEYRATSSTQSTN